MNTKWLISIRISFSNAVKHLMVCLSKFIKYKVVFIKKNDFICARSNPLFIVALQFGRIVNSIRSCQRIMLRIIDWGRLADTKDWLEQLLIFSSYTYEGVKEFFRREPDFSQLALPANLTNKVEMLRKEKDNHGSQYWQVLSDIRNRVSFHFVKQCIENTVGSMRVQDETKFLVSKTELEKDMIFTLGDDIVLHYIFDRSLFMGPLSNRIEQLHRYLMSISQDLISIMYEVIVLILSPVADIKTQAL